MADSGEAANHGHVPVMRDRMAELIAPAVGAAAAEHGAAVIVDGTLGAGGHTEHFLTVFPEARVIGIDRDPNALREASERLADFGDRFVPAQARFDDVEEVVDSGAGEAFNLARAHGVAGALYDLGVSSMQLDQVERGFAYRTDAPLDMRMDPTQGITAADVLNTYGHGDLARILKTYGDERFAGKIASAVLRERDKEPFTTSARLVELLYDVIPAATRRTGLDVDGLVPHLFEQRGHPFGTLALAAGGRGIAGVGRVETDQPGDEVDDLRLCPGRTVSTRMCGHACMSTIAPVLDQCR